MQNVTSQYTDILSGHQHVFKNFKKQRKDQCISRNVKTILLVLK